MVQRLSHRKRLKSDELRIVKTPGGKLVYRSAKTHVNGRRIQGSNAYPKFRVKRNCWRQIGYGSGSFVRTNGPPGQKTGLIAIRRTGRLRRGQAAAATTATASSKSISSTVTNPVEEQRRSKTSQKENTNREIGNVSPSSISTPSILSIRVQVQELVNEKLSKVEAELVEARRDREEGRRDREEARRDRDEARRDRDEARRDRDEARRDRDEARRDREEVRVRMKEFLRKN